jgi:hypothetical protein
MISSGISVLRGRLNVQSIFNTGIELGPVDRVQISAVSVIQNSDIKIKARLHDKIFNPASTVEISTPG